MGPKVLRISPHEHVFNPTATQYSKSPKFTRYVKSLGELRKEMKVRTDLQFDEEAFQKIVDRRRSLSPFKQEDINKADGYLADGFGTLSEYYGSGLVELLEFEGDYYDEVNDVLYENRLITIVDRTNVLRNIPNQNWLGKDNKVHVGWRGRPDNLYAMGLLTILLVCNID